MKYIINQVTIDKVISLFNDKKIPYLIAFNKSDLRADVPEKTDNVMYVSSKTGQNIYELKEPLSSQF